jgi:hypothetical protein
MRLTRRQLNDYCDPDWKVVKLTRAGHHLWSLIRKKGVDHHQERAFYEALETIWKVKRELKAKITTERASSSARMRSRFAVTRLSQPGSALRQWFAEPDSVRAGESSPADGTETCPGGPSRPG